MIAERLAGKLYLLLLEASGYVENERFPNNAGLRAM
jgi:hypothetical protein